MKNKRLIYLLLPLVIVLWGTIGYRIWQAIEHDNQVDVGPTSNTGATHVSVASKISGPPQLKLTYRDPFTGQGRLVSAAEVAARPATSTSRINASRIFVVNPPKTAIIWPTVEYQGSVENANRRALVAMIRLNGVDFLLKEGAEAGGVKLKKVLRDSVLLVKEKTAKYFRVVR